MFSQRSLKALEGVDGRLRAILDEAIRVYDFTVLEGVRSREKQAEMVRKGGIQDYGVEAFRRPRG